MEFDSEAHQMSAQRTEKTKKVSRQEERFPHLTAWKLL